jgi:hypothetical protein
MNKQTTQCLGCMVIGAVIMFFAFWVGFAAFDVEEAMAEQIRQERCENWQGYMPQDVREGYCND